MKNPTPTNISVIYATLIGFGFACFLQFMRVRFPWWPFHPLGYAVTSSWEINLVWMPLFIAWVLKLVLLRYTGLRVPPLDPVLLRADPGAVRGRKPLEHLGYRDGITHLSVLAVG